MGWDEYVPMVAAVTPALSMHFGILFSALGAILTGQSANGIAHEGEKLAGYDVEPFGFIVLAVVIVFAPLFFFTPKLSQSSTTAWSSTATLPCSTWRHSTDNE
jgi:hypothetical protein